MAAANVMPGIRNLDQQARRYFGAVGWLFRTVIEQHRARVILVFVGSAVGLALVSGGIGGMFAVVSVLESGGSIRLAGFELQAEAEGSMLTIAIAGALLIIAGAIAVFLARSVSVRVAKDVLGLLSANAVATYGGIPPHPLAFRNDRQLASEIRRIRNNYARKCFLVVRMAFDMPVMLLTFVGGVAVLSWLQPEAALVMGLLLVVALPVYYLVNHAAVKMTKRYEALAAPAARESRALLDIHAKRPHDPATAVRAAADAAPASRERNEVFAYRFLATVRTVFTSNVLGGIAFLGLLTYLGTQYFAGRVTITALATFMLVLRFVLATMSAALRNFAFISRFYPSVYRFYLYQKGQDRRRRPPADPAFRLRLTRGGLREPGTPRRNWVVRPGTVLGVNATVSPSRYSVWYFASLLTTGGDGLEATLAVRDNTSVAALPPAPDGPTSARAHFGIPASAGFQDVEAWLSDAERQRLRAAGITSLDAELDPEVLRALPRSVTGSLALAAAWLHDRPIVIVPSRSVPDDISERTRERVTIATYRFAPRHSTADMHVVAASDATIIAWGSASWVHDNWGAIRALRAEHEAELQRRYADHLSDEDDDEEGT